MRVYLQEGSGTKAAQWQVGGIVAAAKEAKEQLRPSGLDSLKQHMLYDRVQHTHI